VTALGKLLSDTRVARVAGAGFMSVIGDGCNAVAIPFAVLMLTRSPLALGVVLAARLFGLLLSLLVGGVVADRFERRNILVSADLARFCVQAVSAGALISGSGTVGLLSAAQLVHGLASGVFLPANGGYLPSIVSKERLQQVNGILVAGIDGGSIVGAVVGGLVTGGWGAGTALAVDAGSFLASAALIIGLPRAGNGREPDGMSAWEKFATGFQEVWSRPWLRVGIAYFIVSQLFINGPLYALGPRISEDHYSGAETWGLVMGAFGLGSVLGGLIASKTQLRRPMPLILLVASLPAVLLLGLAFYIPVFWLFGAALVAGASAAFVDVGWWTLLQRQINERVISRILALDLFGYNLARPASIASAGPLAAVVTAPVVLVAAAAGLVFASVSTASLRIVRVVEGSPPPPETDRAERVPLTTIGDESE
jgi:MFS family permease